MKKRDESRMTSRLLSQATRRTVLSLPYIRKTMGGNGFGGKITRSVLDTLSLETPIRIWCEVNIWILESGVEGRGVG